MVLYGIVQLMCNLFVKHKPKKLGFTKTVVNRFVNYLHRRKMDKRLTLSPHGINERFIFN